MISLMFQKDQSGCCGGNKLRRGKGCNNSGKGEGGLDQSSGEERLDSGHFEGQPNRIYSWVGIGEYHFSYPKSSCSKAQNYSGNSVWP